MRYTRDGVWRLGLGTSAPPSRRLLTFRQRTWRRARSAVEDVPCRSQTLIRCYVEVLRFRFALLHRCIDLLSVFTIAQLRRAFENRACKAFSVHLKPAHCVILRSFHK
jgi:hypothetical protein